METLISLMNNYNNVYIQESFRVSFINFKRKIFKTRKFCLFKQGLYERFKNSFLSVHFWHKSYLEYRFVYTFYTFFFSKSLCPFSGLLEFNPIYQIAGR